jgi:hypothetical protein
MNNRTETTASPCPVGTPWCTQHLDEPPHWCGSSPIDIKGGHCNVWLIQELPGIEPTINIDSRPTDFELTLDQAGDLCDAIQQLRLAAIEHRAVQS